jgi:flagellar hook-associated protein 3 FlgL
MRVNPNIIPDLLNDLWNVQTQEQTATEQVATGRRVNMPSDDPAAAAADVENQAAQSETDQYLQNTSSLEGLFQTADSTLSSVVTSLNQAISLGVEGGSSDLSPSDLQALAQQVQGIQTQVISLANVSYEGNYIFAGTATTTKPFTLDATQPSGVLYNGNSGTNSTEIAEDRTIQVNLPGSQIFLGASGSVLGSLQQLVTALQSGDTTDIANATTQVSSALGYLSEQRVFYGNGMNQLDANQTFLQQENVNLQTQENSLVGANMAQAATNLSQAQTAYSAALAAIAKVVPESLLDYLK